MTPIEIAGRQVARVHPALPIFRIDDGPRTLFYTPGYLEVSSAADAAAIDAALRAGSDDLTSPAARRLETRGRQAVQSWRELAERPFEPECLTVYLSNRCNLGCAYCYAAPVEPVRARRRLRVLSDRADADFPIVSERVVAAAARFVARSCAKKSKPLALILHGGGEPTLHWDLVVDIRREAGLIADAHQLSLWAYIATNGVLPEDRAAWLARHFTVIGLSCDGPPDIQNANRPGASGAPTSAIVERTARVLVASGAEFHVRATITPDAVRRQPEIAAYCCDRLGARTVRFEPAYDGRRSPSRFRPGDAEEFVLYFLEAREAARARGCELHVSGVRLDEIHGPYCNPLREVLQLTPDGTASACFLTAGNQDPEDAAFALGHLDPSTGEFVVDQQRAAAVRRRAARIPRRCEACFNIHHCARDCPDVCLLSAEDLDERHEGFRCRTQKLLALAWIREMADGWKGSEGRGGDDDE